MTYQSPEPWDPDDSLEARRQADYDRTAARLARERRDRAAGDFQRMYGPAEGRHQGHDDGEHHWKGAFPAGGLWKYECGCSSCQAAETETHSTPELDLIDRTNPTGSTAYRRALAETRAYIAASRDPMTASEVKSWLATNGSYHDGPQS